MSTLKTNVVGYFNPNDYPMQIVVAEHNLTIQLQPKQYIVDRAGRLVNDPILDKYVGKGRLSRAINQKQQTEVVKLVGVNHVAPSGQPATQFSHPVYSATGFIRDQNGQMSPVMATNTAPMPTVQPPVSYNPVKAMSVEDAKRLKLIKPTRPIKEDCGADDSTGAPLPGDRTPVIQYQTDTVREKTQPLPEALAQPVTTAQAQLVQGLQMAQRIDPENPRVLDQVGQAVRNLPVNTMPEVMVQPSAPPPTPMDLLKKAPPPIPVNPAPTVMITNAPLPEPEIGDGLVVEEEIATTFDSVSADNVPTAPTRVAVPPPPAEEVDEAGPATNAGTMKCPLCPSKDFNHPGYLKRHINNKHAAQATHLLQQVGLL